MHFCLQCGSDQVESTIPPGDNREREVCKTCGFVYYRNPKNVAGCILEWEGRILLCRRGIEPRYGKWTVPAGFMENGETTAEAAARESREEASAEALELQLHSLFSLPHISQVYLLYRGKLAGGLHEPNEETLETELYEEGGVPWDQLAFPVIAEGLRLYFEDRRRGAFTVHTGDIIRLPDRRLEVRHH